MNPHLVCVTSLALATVAGTARAQCRPSVPTGVRASDGANCAFVEVTWNRSAGTVLYYTIYRGTSPSTATTVVGTSIDPAFRDFIALGTAYYYRVAAFGPCGGSNYSGADRGHAGTEPARPTGLEASYATVCDGVFVAWSGVPNTANYQVWRNDSPDFQTSTLVGISNDTSLLDVTPVRGQEWYYWVTAQNLCGRSEPAGPATGYAGQVPQPPTRTNATDDRCDGINITWIGAEDIGSVRPITYRVLRGTTQFYPLAQEIGHIIERVRPKTSWYEFLDTSAEVGTRYHYWVEAENACGDSMIPYDDPGERLAWAHRITRQPADQVAGVGSRVRFSAETEGTGLTYQWFKADEPLNQNPGGRFTGVWSPTFVIDPVEPGDAGSYRVEVSGGVCPSSPLRSAAAGLEVVSCYPDCDPSGGIGVLDIFDFLCFQNRYDAGDPYACDCDTSSGPSVCDIFDFLCFQNAYDNGCP